MKTRMGLWTALLLAVATASSAEIEISGRAVDETGAPLAEVDVLLTAPGSPIQRTVDLIDGRRAEPAARAKTGNDGRFRINAPTPGHWIVRLEAAGYVPRVRPLQALVEATALESATLEADSGLTVRVLGANGAALAGAAVKVATDTGRYEQPGAWRAPLRAGRTDAEGKLRVSRAAREVVRVAAAHAGHAPEERRGVRGNSARVTLGAARPVRIELRDADGSKVAGAILKDGRTELPIGRTDDAGLATIDIGATPIEVIARAGDGREVSRTIAAPAPSAEPRLPTRLDLPAAVRIAGRVLDMETRRGIPSAFIQVLSDPDSGALADENGLFTLVRRLGETGELSASATGYLAQEVDVTALGGDARGPTIALRPASAIEGRVLDPKGDPIAGAELAIEVRPAPGEFRVMMGVLRSQPRAISGADGGFRIGGLDPEAPFDLRAQAAGFASAEQPLAGLEPRKTRRGLRVTLDRGGSILGRLVDADGHAIRDAAIVARPAREERRPRFMGQGPEAGDELLAASDGEGRFSVSGLAKGRVDLDIKRSGFATRRMRGIEIADGGAPVDLGSIVLARGVRVTGVVLDDQGRPVEGASVQAVDADASPRMAFMPRRGGAADEESGALTDANGFFEVVDQERDARIDLACRRQGYVPGRAHGVVVPPEAPVEIRLDPASDVLGRVVNDQGEPIPGAEVQLRRMRSIARGGNRMAFASMEGAEADAEGRFRFDDQEPGEVGFSASAPGWQEAKLDGQEIPRGADLEGVELRLSRGASVTGRVLDADGAPVIGAQVAKVGDAEGPMRFRGGASSDGDGRYRLDGLAPGSVSIEATHDDHARAVRDVELREGENALDLRMEGGQSIEGRVVDPAGDPVPGALVRLARSRRVWDARTVRSDGTGSFAFSGVQEGDWQLSGEAEGFASSSDVPVRVAAEPVRDVTIALRASGIVVGQVAGLDPRDFEKTSVRAEGPGTSGWLSSSVDFEGRFRIDGLAPGTYDVVGAVDGSARQARSRATVEAGVEVRADLSFGGGLRLTGHALQGEQPVAGATLSVEGIDIDVDGWTETDRTGAFAIEGLEAGKYEIHLQHGQTGLSHRETVEVATSREIVLRVPTSRVLGLVSDASDDAVLAGVRVWLESPAAPSDSVPDFFPRHAATTDQEGRFTIDNVGDGSWNVVAEKQGYARRSLPVQVARNRDVDDLRLRLDPTEGLSLEIRRANGAIPDEVRIAVLDPTGFAVSSGGYSTGEGGRVRLRSVPAGQWQVLVGAEGSATVSVTAMAPGTSNRVELPPPCSLRVSVPELVGTPLISTVTVTGAGGQPFRSVGFLGQPTAEWRMSGGERSFDALPPGQWSIRVSTPDGRSWQGQTTTTPGAPATVKLGD